MEHLEGLIEIENNKDMPKKFVPNEKYNCYVVDKYGAWMGDIKKKKEIENYKILGYKLKLGPSSNKHYKYGVFCTNYKKLLKKKKENVEKQVLSDLVEKVKKLEQKENINNKETKKLKDSIVELSSIVTEDSKNLDELYKSVSYLIEALEIYSRVLSSDDDNDLSSSDISKIDDYEDILVDLEEDVSPSLDSILRRPIENPISSINVEDLINDISKKFICQEAAVESIVSNIYANQIVVDSDDLDFINSQKASILIDGPTGTGKTAIVFEIANRLNLPIVRTNATEYSKTGFVGGDLSNVFVELFNKAEGNLNLAERGIVIIDEIDKLGHSVQNPYNVDYMDDGVQSELLSYIGGTKVNIPVATLDGGYTTVELDTSKVTFICMGAFTPLRERKIADVDRGGMGFTATLKGHLKDEDKVYTITEKDYIDFGLKRELVGRFALQTYTHTYSVDDYKKILLESEISPLKAFVEFVKKFGIDNVTYDDEFITKAAEKAYKDDFGARGLQKTMENIKDSMLRDILNGNITEIRLTSDDITKQDEKTKRKF